MILGGSCNARQQVAEACGYIYEDSKCWASTEEVLSSKDWLQRSKAIRSMEVCARKLTEMCTNLFDSCMALPFLLAEFCGRFDLELARKKYRPKSSSAGSLHRTYFWPWARGFLIIMRWLVTRYTRSIDMALSYDAWLPST